MDKIVFLVEEPSMEATLAKLIPRLYPDWTYGFNWQCIPHEGKNDLQKSIPRKLRGWREPGVIFVILHDQDQNDCKLLKSDLEDLCKSSGRPDTLIRIVCHELESWFIGDLEAVSEAFQDESIKDLQSKRKYRKPDNILKPSKELARIVNGYQKISGAKKITPHLNLDDNLSKSFIVFLDGLSSIVNN